MRQVHWGYAWTSRRMAKAIVSTGVDYGMGVWICAALVMIQQLFMIHWHHKLRMYMFHVCIDNAVNHIVSTHSLMTSSRWSRLWFAYRQLSYSNGFDKIIFKHLFTETSLDHSRSNETANTMQCYLQVQTLGQLSSVIDKDDTKWESEQIPLRFPRPRLFYSQQLRALRQLYQNSNSILQ